MRRKTLGTIIFSVIALTAISSIIIIKTSLANDAAASGLDASIADWSSGSLAADEINRHDFTYIPPTLEGTAGDTKADMAELGADILDEPFVPATEMDLDPESLTVFVNKEYALPKNYKPADLVQVNVKFNLKYYDERTYLRKEAAKALEDLFEAAQKDGYIIYGVSGYRSYERQRKIFMNNIVKQGKEHTLRYSAVPGTSEHQTGLAIDVSTEALDFKLSTDFAASKEGIWLAEHAHYYGYIIRYPEGKAEITGYFYEPWHIRYVGKTLANYLFNNQLTLDEYYKYTPSKNFDFEATYAELINYVPPRATPIPVEEDEVVVGENGEIIDGALEEELTEDSLDIEEDTKSNDKNTDSKKQDDENENEEKQNDENADSSGDNITDTPAQPTSAPENEDPSADGGTTVNEEDNSSTNKEPGTGEDSVSPVPTPAAEDEGTQEITPFPTVVPAK